ncbi:hypothetical protein [Streptomyces halstedii]
MPAPKKLEHLGIVAEFALALDHLQGFALSPQASADLIRSVIEEKYCDS